MILFIAHLHEKVARLHKQVEVQLGASIIFSVFPDIFVLNILPIGLQLTFLHVFSALARLIWQRCSFLWLRPEGFRKRDFLFNVLPSSSLFLSFFKRLAVSSLLFHCFSVFDFVFLMLKWKYPKEKRPANLLQPRFLIGCSWSLSLHFTQTLNKHLKTSIQLHSLCFTWPRLLCCLVLTKKFTLQFFLEDYNKSQASSSRLKTRPLSNAFIAFISRQFPTFCVIFCKVPSLRTLQNRSQTGHIQNRHSLSTRVLPTLRPQRETYEFGNVESENGRLRTLKFPVVCQNTSQLSYQRKALKKSLVSERSFFSPLVFFTTLKRLRVKPDSSDKKLWSWGAAKCAFRLFEKVERQFMFKKK